MSDRLMRRPDPPPVNAGPVVFFACVTPRLADSLISACVTFQRQRRLDGLTFDPELGDLIAALARARPGPAVTSVDESSTTGDGGDEKLLLTYREAAGQLAISERHVKRLIAGGRLRRVKLGAAARIHIDDLTAYTDTLREDT